MRTTMGALMLLIAVNGCGPPVYRIRTTVPWPDEWLAGPRRPDRIDLPLNLDTVNWHKRTASRSVRARVDRIAASYPNALIMSRKGFGDLRGKTGDRLNALSFVEVRVTGWPLPYSRESRRFNWNIEGVSLEQVLQQFSIGLGEELILSGEVDGAMPISFHAKELGASLALAGMLLENDLYLAPACLGTSVLRSYEYKSQNAFLRAVQKRAAAASSARPKGPYEVMNLERWTQVYEPQLARLHLWADSRSSAMRKRRSDQKGASGDRIARDTDISPAMATVAGTGDRAERSTRYLARLIQLRLDRMKASAK